MFSVYQEQKAMAPLHEVWEDADDALRSAIGSAMRCIGQELQNEPQEKGESRHGETRILFQAPVAVIFEIDEKKQLVRILRAWAYRNGTGRNNRAA